MLAALVLALGVASAAEPAADPALSSTDEAPSYGLGQGLALTGFGMGVAGNLVDAGAALSLFDDIDQETFEIDPAATAAIYPVSVGGQMVRRTGAVVMGIGVLQMHRHNKALGVTDKPRFGQAGLGLGIGSLVLYGVGAALTIPDPDAPPPDPLSPTPGSTLVTLSGLMAIGSFTTNFIQYVMNNANRPPARRPIEGRVERRRLHRVAIGPTHNGLMLTGSF